MDSHFKSSDYPASDGEQMRAIIELAKMVQTQTLRSDTAVEDIADAMEEVCKGIRGVSETLSYQ